MSIVAVAVAATAAKNGRGKPAIKYVSETSLAPCRPGPGMTKTVRRRAPYFPLMPRVVEHPRAVHKAYSIIH
jgi:hypothetical protein